MNYNDLIIRPLISEKSYALSENKGYVFEVHKSATKVDIKKAIETIFDVKVKKINIINVKPKAKRMGKYEGFKKSYKKAYVFLKEGIIPIYGADEDQEQKTTDKKASTKSIEKALEENLKNSNITITKSDDKLTEEQRIENLKKAVENQKKEDIKTEKVNKKTEIKTISDKKNEKTKEKE